MTAIPDDLWQGLDPRAPVALVPVRVETRLAARAQGDLLVPVLRVRIYPDDLAISGAGAGLAPAEDVAGRAFWAAHDAADSDQARRAAWVDLAAAVGAVRAPVVARAVRAGEIPGSVGAPTARLLPDSWILLGYLDGQVVLSHHVTGVNTSLQVGPTPGTAPLDPDEPLLIAEDGLKWTTDFQRALAEGMAAQVDLATPDQVADQALPPVVTRGLDRLVVLGVDAATTAEAGAVELADVLSGHAVTGRFGFVPQGTPTNNVGDRKAGWIRDPDPFAAFERALDTAAPGAVDDALTGGPGATAGAALAGALGVPLGTFAGAENASDLGLHHASLMSRALFPVTLGEVTEQLLLPPDRESLNYTLITGEHAGQLAQDVVPSAQAIQDARAALDPLRDFARDHWTRFVRARGPLPTLRVGRQPYGILPLTLMDRWAPSAGEPALMAGLVRLLRLLRPVFRAASADLPHLGDARAPWATMAAVLQQSALPQLEGLFWRPISYGYLMTHEKAIAEEVATQALRRNLATPLGLVDTRLESLRRYQGRPLRTAVATDMDSRFPTILGPDPGDFPDLLSRLLVRSLKLALELDTRRVGEQLGLLDSTAAILSLKEFGLATHAAAVRRSFDTALQPEMLPPQVAAVAGGLTPLQIAQVPQAQADLVAALNTLPGVFAAQHTPGFPGTREAISALAGAGLTDEAYAGLLAESLACASTRLDSWCTSVATARLAALRADGTPGVHLGCWGLVMDLRWDYQAVRARYVTPVAGPQGWVAPGDPGDVARPASQVGYVHGPTLDHARTAAVLRAAELAHANDPTLARIDLTSRRARMADTAIRSVRAGVPLGLVLGSMLEERLGEQGRYHAIASLREAYPGLRRSGTAGTPAPGSEHVPVSICDGLDILAAADPAAVCPEEDRADVLAALAEIRVASEAIADTLVAQGVHDLVAGRRESAASSFAAIAAGRPLPGNLSVLATPRHGVTLTHRVLVAMTEPRPALAGWTVTPRVGLAPEMESWAQQLLGPATAYRVRIDGRGAEHNPLSADVELAALGVSALDVLCEVGSGPPRTGATGRPPGLGGLGARVAAAADLAIVTEARLVETEDRSWSRLLATCHLISGALATARPALGEDLNSPPDLPVGSTQRTVPPAPGPDPASLSEIAGRLHDALADLAGTTLDAPGDEIPDTDPLSASQLDLLRRCAAWGIAGAAATRPVVADMRRAQASARSQLSEVAKALPPGAAEAVTPVPASPWWPGIPTGDPGQRTAWVAALVTSGIHDVVAACVALAGYAVIPIPLVHSELPGAEVPDVAPEAVGQWLEQVSRVRTSLGCWDDLTLLTDREPRPVAVMQLPRAHVQREGWLAGPLQPVPGSPEPGDPPAPRRNDLRGWVRPTGPRSHTAVIDPQQLGGGPMVRALVLDDFTEVLPEPTATTGVGAYYDAPDARPPQSILLAINPDLAAPWSWPVLAGMVEEAVELSRLRLVELEDLEPLGVGEYLPLIYVPDLADWDVDPATLRITDAVGQRAFRLSAAALAAFGG